MDMKIKVTFAPGCFDNFEGTQEELDQLIKEIQEGFENGEFFLEAEEVDQDSEFVTPHRTLQ